MSQPSATSRPAVRQRPWQIASVGIGSASSLRTVSISGWEKFAASSGPPSTIRWKAFTSTPPLKMSPSARQTAARTSDSSISPIASPSWWKASSVKRLSGGFERMIWPTSPSRSMRMTWSAIRRP